MVPGYHATILPFCSRSYCSTLIVPCYNIINLSYTDTAVRQLQHSAFLSNHYKTIFPYNNAATLALPDRYTTKEVSLGTLRLSSAFQLCYRAVLLSIIHIVLHHSTFLPRICSYFLLRTMLALVETLQ